MKHPLVLAITGASGVIHALRLLEVLLDRECEVHLTISPSGKEVLRQELGISVDLEQFHAASLTRSSLCTAANEATEFESTIVEVLAGLSNALTAESNVGTMRYHHHADFMAPIASGSFVTTGMVICPCSGSTLSAVVHGASNNLIQRAADVHLKERRPVILVPRETPLSSIQLDNMKRASEAGAVVLPAMPGWYHGVRSMRDLIDFVVARILDQVGIEHSLIRRWGETSRD
ncbi:MAG: UbiX family flavin prenyltransferase [Pirellulaceae bacterium]|nr:UbiX family flavin prenyltransferase [Pirellulaceae bacterium]